MASEHDVERLYADHAPRLRRYLLLKTRQPDLAADLAQECFARLMLRAQQQGVPENTLSYLFTVANHLLIDYRRNHHQSRTETMEHALLHEIVDQADGPDLLTESRQQLERLYTALADLPVRSRQVFQLCRFEGMSYKDAANHLNISTSSVQKHLAMALAYVSERLGRPS